MVTRRRDLPALMRLLNDGRDDDRDPAAALPWAVLEGLRSVVPSDAVSFFLLDTAARATPVAQSLPADPDESDPAAAGAPLAAFFEHYWDCAPCSYFDQGGDLDRVVLISDFYTLPQYRSTGMWSQYLSRYDATRELIVCVGGHQGRTLRLVFSRAPGRDFDDDDRATAWLLRPHLNRLYRQRHAPAGGAGALTPRQRELLRHVATGHTNRQIGRQLGISESTVRKHLENVFERLRVPSRTAAVAHVFPDGPPGGAPV